MINYHCCLKFLHVFPLGGTFTTESPLIKLSQWRLCCAYPPQSFPSAYTVCLLVILSVACISVPFSILLHIKITNIHLRVQEGKRLKDQLTGSPRLKGDLRMRKGAGGLNPWGKKRPNGKLNIRRNIYFQVKIYNMYKHMLPLYAATQMCVSTSV